MSATTYIFVILYFLLSKCEMTIKIALIAAESTVQTCQSKAVNSVSQGGERRKKEEKKRKRIELDRSHDIVLL